MTLAMCALSLASLKSDSVYVFTSFRGNGDGLHLAYSTDGYHWTDTAPIYLRPEVGSKLFRDPQIVQEPNGKFHMVWTTGWNDKGIGYASSTDLVHWSAQKFLPLMEGVPGTRDCWAPEAFFDSAQKQFLITWSSDVEGRFPETVSKDRMNHRTYAVTTKDFESFSEPKLFLDPGFDHIDATLTQSAGKTYAIFKEGDMQAKGRHGPLWLAESENPSGPYTVRKTPLLTQRAEGPALVTVGDKTLLYIDFYADGRYGVYETTDWQTWKDVSSQAEVVNGQRHGSIIRVPKKILDGMLREQKAVMRTVPKPILKGFTADPAIRVFGDKYYIYPTSDKPNWQTTDFSVWSSSDLIHWKKSPIALDVTKDLKWANIEAWAPDTLEKNGKYYFYFCAQGQIGVAVGDKPTGPFKDALGHPLVAKGSVKTYPIDPYPLIDEDGQAYLFFGNGTPTVYKLNDDMISFKGEPTYIPMKDFREGIAVFKRKGLYYFMWSVDDARSDDYHVAYGTSKSLFGPVESPANNVVLIKNGLAKGTGHHSIVNVPGTDRWYVIYHRHAIPGGGGFKRETCIARMEFAPDGSILPINPLAPVFPKGSKGEPIH